MSKITHAILRFLNENWLACSLLLLLGVLIYLEVTGSVITDNDKGITTLHEVLIIILTFMLVWVAWFQLYKIRRRSRADFLMRIDARYCCSESVKARTIIHKFYRKTGNEICDEVHIEKIANEIKEIGKSNDDKNCEDFILLLDFLDLLETIAYFSNQKYINVEELSELSGNSIVYYYKVFKPWIYYRRKKYNDDSNYLALQTLAQKISGDKKL